MSATKNSSPPKGSSPKSSPKSPATSGSASPGTAIARGLHATICILALSLATSTAKQVLTPLFGSVATNLLLQRAVLSSTVVSSLLPKCASAPVLGSVLAVATPIFHQVGAFMARRKDPLYGPLMAYLPVLAPVAWLTVSAVRNSLPFASTSSFRQTGAVFSGITVALAITNTQNVWPSKPLFDIINLPLLSIVFGWLVVITGEFVTRLEARSSSKKSTTHNLSRLVALLPIMVTTFIALNTSPTRPLSLPYTVYNSTDGTTPLLRVLSSTQSITGRIVVAENYEHGFRYLRADHSLLGGLWIGNKVHSMDASEQAWFARDIHGEKLGDSIYTTFVLQEAVRFQQREGKQEKALIIGLGAGISASAFSRHGLNTTVVEIDPAVYAAARDWLGFGLSEETKPVGGVYLEDARGWVQRRVSEQEQEPNEADKFDIIVHDCFSGGGVPEQLFTLEFWQMLKKIMTKEGVVAVNFAGQIDSNPAKAILATLQKSFTTCRVFHDYYPETPEDRLAKEFINIVYFCTSSPMPLLFDHASPSDYLNSYLREYVLGNFYAREVKLDLIRGNLTRDSVEESALGYVLTDDKNLLGRWEDEAALEHWGLMRTVMGPLFWETY